MAVNDGGPTLSIGIPVHNGARYLAHTLDSLRAAELDDVEILISDNASTDETGDIVRSAAAADPRLRYIRQPENIGPAENFNYVFRNTTGTFFSWLAYDDLIEPTFYRQMVEMLHARPDAAAAMSRVRLIDSSGGLMDHSDELVEGDHPDAVERFIRYAGFAHWCQFCYGVARRSAMEKTRLLGTYWSGDRLYCAELALAGPLLRHPETLYFVRQHTDRLTRRHSRRDHAAVTAYLTPRGSRAVTLHYSTQLRESLERAALSPEDKARGRRALRAWMVRNSHRLARSAGRAALEAIAKPFVHSGAE
jgi:glycosyltransferase involved in cell wall biosynthesis